MEVTTEDLSGQSKTLLHKISKDTIFHHKQIILSRKPKWYITTAIINMKHKEVDISFDSSHSVNRNEAAQRVLQSIVTPMLEVDNCLPLHDEQQASQGNTEYHLCTCQMAPYTFVLLFMTNRL